MAMDPVPFVIGGGAHHSPEVFRLMAGAATNGAEGIVNVGDMRVTALGTPGAAVRVSVGGAIIASRASGAGGQSYVARNATTTQVAVSATGSNARYDLVVCQVEDPNPAGEPWNDPSNTQLGPYVHIRVIANVPPGTTRLQDVAGYSGRTAITLARLNIPANTTAITNAMITDLREVALPREKSGKHMSFPTSDVAMPTTNYSGWPAGIGTQVRVPDWATRCMVTANIGGIEASVNSGRTVAGIRTYVGPGQQPGDAAIGVELGENGILVDEGGTTPRRPHITIAGIHNVTKYQGDMVWIMTQAVRSSGNATLLSDYQTTCVLDWVFLES